MRQEAQDMGENMVAGQIAEMTAGLAASRKGASAAASAVIECMVAAAEPLIIGLFKDNGSTLQERLLFTLVLVGACSTLDRDSDHLSLQVEISPTTLNEAFQTYKGLTGKDMTKHVPEEMRKFANQAARLN
jgi:hypothetical protein